MIQGVNRHDVDPRTGRVMSRQTLVDQLSLLKRCNVNAIRTSHYPNDPEFLELCDEFGFYVVDEADIESHAFASTLCDDPRYLTTFVERVSRMVLRDRNHPSIIMWSLGNESGYGANHDAAAGWLRRFDPTRPLHCEGTIRTNWHGGHTAGDVVCPMYPSFESLAGFSAHPAADRPVILCEYAYSEGNSTGGLAEYWAMFESLPGLQGGFIWEFSDHALDPDADGHYRYGGNFGDQPNDGSACLNGIVFADNTPKPALYEARGLFSPARTVSGSAQALAGTITLRNRQTFNDLSAYTFEARIETRHGSLGAVPVEVGDIPADGQATIGLPSALRELIATESPLALTLRTRTKDDTAWAPAATTVSWQQVVLPQERQRWPKVADLPVRVDDEGAIAHPLLRQPPRLCLWRALTDNGASFARNHRFVRTGFFQLTATSVDIEHVEDGVTVTTRYTAAYGSEVRHRRTITALGNHDYRFAEHVVLPEGTRDGLRVGIEFELVDGFTDAHWVGLGPWENYPDRRSSALLGSWHSAIDELAVPYVVPQENGGRGAVAEVRLTGPPGCVRTSHRTPVQINVGRYSVDQLETSRHWWELPPSNTTIVHLDVAHRGLGTGVRPDTRPRFRLGAREYRCDWRLALALEP